MALKQIRQVLEKLTIENEDFDVSKISPYDITQINKVATFLNKAYVRKSSEIFRKTYMRDGRPM